MNICNYPCLDGAWNKRQKVHVCQDASGRTTKHHNVKTKHRVNENNLRPHSRCLFLPCEKIPSDDDVTLLQLRLHLSCSNFLHICISVSSLLLGWHQTSVVSTPLTRSQWPPGLLRSPAWPLPTSQPATICLFIRLCARLIWPLSRTVGY